MKYILSFKTYGKRLLTIENYIEKTFFSGLDLNKYKVVMNLDSNEVCNIPIEVKKKYIDTNKIELLVGNDFTGPHGKYFYVMQKYRDLPIITLDDDFIYTKESIEFLTNFYEQHKDNCVYSFEGEIVDIKQPYFRFFALTNIVQAKKRQYMTYKVESTKYNLLNNGRFDTMVNGFGMILYPPNILKIDENYYNDYICEDKERRIDDFVLCIREQDLGVKRCIVEYPKELGIPYDHSHSQHGLSDRPDVYDYTTDYWLKHNSKFFNTEITEELSTRRANYMPREKKKIYKALCDKYKLPCYLHTKETVKEIYSELEGFFE